MNKYRTLRIFIHGEIQKAWYVLSGPSFATAELVGGGWYHIYFQDE